MLSARRNGIHAATTEEGPDIGPARLALRLALGLLAAMQEAMAPEDARSARRRWIGAGSLLTALRVAGEGRARMASAAERWTFRLGARFAPRGTAVVDRWARVGRFEEIAGRQLLRDIAGSSVRWITRSLATRPELFELVDEIVDHLADRPPELTRLVNEITQSLIHDPEVKALIHEQSTSLLGSVLKSFRDEAARADTAVERGFAALERHFKSSR